jgi:hypothetical protein
VYTLKNRYKKGANRLCTVLYYYLRKVKHGPTDSRFARSLYLHADNYSENKNNVVLQFLSELGELQRTHDMFIFYSNLLLSNKCLFRTLMHVVMRGWFDDIYVEFGPTGHTHNGTDAVHHIHNRVLDFSCYTLPTPIAMHGVVEEIN